jgi:hypothetical protein
VPEHQLEPEDPENEQAVIEGDLEEDGGEGNEEDLLVPLTACCTAVESALRKRRPKGRVPCDRAHPAHPSIRW